MHRSPGSSSAASSANRTSLRSALGRLKPYFQGLTARWTLGLLSAVGAGVVALSIPQVLQVLINSLLDDEAATRAVWIAAGVMLALGILEAGLVYMRRFFVLPVASEAETRMRVQLFSTLQDLSARFHAEWGAGQLQSRAIADLNMLRRWFAFGSVMFVTSVISVLVGFVLMVSLSPLLALIFVIAAVPIMVIAPRFRQRFVHFSRSAQDQAGEVATRVEESVHGIRVLKAFGGGEHALSGFHAEAIELRDLEVSKARTLAKFLMAMVMLPESVLGICLLIGLWQVAHQESTGVTVGALAAFFATAAVLKGPIESVGMLLGMTFTAKTAIDRHIEVMDAPVDVQSPSAPRSAPEQGLLEIEELRFRYPGAEPAEPDLLRGVSLRVEPGETVALVSSTGGGTSTLLTLIPRVYDTTEGSIRIDGVDVRELDLADLRSRVALAFDDPTLFSASAEENVLLGTAFGREREELARSGPGDRGRPNRPDDPHHPADRDEALQTALHDALTTAEADFVYDLPDGVRTPIGEEGLSLSGGQRQRLALARAIAAAPSVLLLDDPLSALDVRTEERVTAKLRDHLSGTTTLIVAHRPSTVALADRVAVLHEGRIADIGTHLELLERSTIYRAVMSTSAEPAGLMDAIPVQSHQEVGQYGSSRH